MIAEEIVDDALGRRAQQFVRHAFAAEAHHVFQRIAVAAIEVQEMIDQTRRVIDGGAQFLNVRRRPAEDRILQRIPQVGQ